MPLQRDNEREAVRAAQHGLEWGEREKRGNVYFLDLVVGKKGSLVYARVRAIEHNGITLAYSWVF